jgi:hypothetical protein
MLDRTVPISPPADVDPEANRVERLLLEADLLVRAGRAELDGETLVVAPAGSPPSARVELPLPPAAGAVTVRLAHAGAVLSPEALDPRALLEALGASVRDGLRGRVSIEQGDAEVALRWEPPASLVPAEALAVACALREELDAAVVAGAKPAEGFAERLEDRLGLLDRLFPQRVARRDPAAGRLIDLTAPGAGSGAWITVRRVDLASPGAGAGVWIALRVAGEGPLGRSALVAALVRLARHRFGLELVPCDDPALLPPEAAASGAVLFTNAVPTDLSFLELAAALRDLARFVRSLDGARAEGIDLYGAFDVLRPAEDTADEVREATPASAPGETESAPEPAAPPRENAVLAFIGPEKTGPSPALPEWPPRALLAAGPGAPPTPAEPPKAPAPPALDRMSAREVVKRLQGAEAASEVDVFMTHPGYNVEKTVKIMSIVLSLSREDALARCENVPALLAAQVTRAKAVQLKTVLEGTGARFRVVLPEAE